MLEVVPEVLVRALVDEVGLVRTLRILSRARAKDETRHPGKLNPDLVGMEGYAKKYAERLNCICHAGFGMNLSCPLHGLKEGRGR